MKSTLTYSEKDAGEFDFDRPLAPGFGAFRRWIARHGFSGITEFLLVIFLDILTNL